MSNDKDAFNVSDLTTALIQENRADLVNALKNKIQSLAGQHSDVLESLTPSVRKRVEVLREIQGQHDELEAKFFEERAALEAKYQKIISLSPGPMPRCWKLQAMTNDAMIGPRARMFICFTS
ncbi:hypothetical protein Ahy_B01g054969 isoform A [Arachis hypogaea]|uniref:Nucleosome assembly protein n=1 Tax=Arachis hypogaea TaxID=3818 RepID=A0A445AUS4_ARAHY|nr:hypothetical protein Ahy_B01g054969 isoform A [Arachis hypogaea]